MVIVELYAVVIFWSDSNFLLIYIGLNMLWSSRQVPQKLVRAQGVSQQNVTR